MKLKNIVAWFLSCITVSFMISSCDNSLDPLDRDTGVFAIYGFFDLNEEEHYFRIRDLNTPFTLEATKNLDAEVTLLNLTLGSTLPLENKQQEIEGSIQHNFLFNGKVNPDHEYKIRVERSDGFVVEAITRTPTKPDPVVDPLNQNCYVPIEFSLEPMNGGTVVLRFGLGPSKDDPWGTPIVLKSESQGILTHTFTPHNQVILLTRVVFPDLRCGQALQDGNIYVSYIHYSSGFYEQIENDPFDILQSTQRFGALYYDTLAVPVDTSPVCPQDC